MKLCSRLLMVFGRNFCEKRKIGAYEPYFREVRGDARPWLVARWKARGRLSIRVNGTFFRCLLRFHSYESNCVQLGSCYRGSISLHSNFTWTGSSHQPFLASGNSGLRDDENRIPLRYLILTQYWSVPDKRRAVKTTDNANTLISRAR